MDATTLDNRLARLIARFGETFTWSGTSYACSSEGLGQSRQNDLDGMLPSFDLVLHTRAALFTGARPQRGQAVTFGGQTYRIDRDELSPDFGVELTLFCVAAHG